MPDNEDQYEKNRERIKPFKVTIDAVRGFLERIRQGLVCEFCRDGVYDVAPYPTDQGLAGIIATPVPDMQNLGAWFYAATCNKCGDSRFFHAHTALAAMRSEH